MTDETFRYECQICGYIYNPDEGDLKGEILPGTSYEDLPADWICPECDLAKDHFMRIQE